MTIHAFRHDPLAVRSLHAFQVRRVVESDGAGVALRLAERSELGMIRVESGHAPRYTQLATRRFQISVTQCAVALADPSQTYRSTVLHVAVRAIGRERLGDLVGRSAVTGETSGVGRML